MPVHSNEGRYLMELKLSSKRDGSPEQIGTELQDAACMSTEISAKRSQDMPPSQDKQVAVIPE